MTVIRRVALTALVVGLGCSSKTTHTTAATGSGGHPSSTTASGTATTSTGFVESTSGTGGSGGCSAAAKLGWVVSDFNDTYGNVVYTFDPGTKDFVPVVALNCPSPGDLHAMAVSRGSIGWFDYTDMTGDTLFTMDLARKGDCAQFAKLPPGFGLVGIAFAADAPGGDTETLYLSGANSALAKVDVSAKSVVPVATFTGDPNIGSVGALLAGTADAKLFGLFATAPDSRVTAIDRSTAGILSDKTISGIDPTVISAFTTWGGDMFVFTTPNPGADSHVARYNPTTGQLDAMWVPDPGFAAIGAAVTTCAPTN